MPAIKLKKVSAEYLAEKEREKEREKEKEREENLKDKTKKNLEDVADEAEAAKEDEMKEEENEKDVKTHNFLEVEILFDKRKRTLPLSEQRLVEWLDSNLMKKDEVTLPLQPLYEYYSEVCQMQGQAVVDVPVFHRYVRDKFGKTFGFQENSPYRVLLKERKPKIKTKVEGETPQVKIRDSITDVINEIGNPRKGIMFNAISKALMHKYPVHRVDIYPKKLRYALERGVSYGYIELMKGVGLRGYYRLPGEPTKEEPEEKKDKKGGKKEEDETKENGEASAEGDEKSSEEKSSEDEKKEEEVEKKEGEEGEVKTEEEKEEKKPKKKAVKKKKKPVEKWVRGGLARHSDPEKLEDAFPLAITYQSDPKEATGGKIKNYIAKNYHEEVGHDRLKKALEKGVEKGMWECTSGNAPTGRFHLLIESFNPGRSDKLKDQIAQAIVACNEPKQASAQLIKKYITNYHPKFNIENKIHTLKLALERSCQKGTLRQLSGLGLSGTFQLVTPFFPSPAILAGDTSDSEEVEDDSSDEELEYVPRPTKRGRATQKPKPKPVSQPASKAKPKSKAPEKRAVSKGRERSSKAKTAKYYEVTSESESEGELEVEYTPTPSKRRGGVATPANTASKRQEPKSSGRSKSKVTPVIKQTAKPKPKPANEGKSKRKAAQSPAIVDVSDVSEESDEEVKAKEEYTPRPSKSRGGGGSAKQTPALKSPAKPRGFAKRKLVEESDADDESDGEKQPKSAPPAKKGRGERASAGKKSYAEVDDEVESASDLEAPPTSAKYEEKKTAGKVTVESASEKEEAAPPPAKKGRGARTSAGKKSYAVEDDEEESGNEVKAAPQAEKKGKGGRASSGNKYYAVEDDDDEESGKDEKTAPQPEKKERVGRSNAGQKSYAEEEVGEEISSGEEATPPPAKKPKSGAAGKTAKSGKRKR